MRKKKVNQAQLQEAEHMVFEHRVNEVSLIDLNMRLRPINEKQRELKRAILENRITFVNGVAGTGKTLIALMVGLELLKSRREEFSKIILTKPAVEIYSRNSLGALPGTLEEKIQQYYMHFIANLKKLVGEESTKRLYGRGLIENIVLNFVRGITLGDVSPKGENIGYFCILDEAQNTTVAEMKSYISRLGVGSKMVIIGDTNQIDIKLAKGAEDGLTDAIKRFYGLEGIGIVDISEEDIVRDPFLKEIMKQYNT
jgi:phosphate starvation-inducible PhoH-like protein